MTVRLQKFLADAGVASRRASERIIVEGRVEVNGVVVNELGAKVDDARDHVVVDGQVIKTRRKLYVALHKPPGYLCTRSDPKERRTIADLLPQEWTSLYSVGRLDNESEGLIFLTNDGNFCLKLTHPRYGVHKSYRVVVEGKLDHLHLKKMMAGVEEGGERLKVQKASLISASNSHSEAELELAEGKNREIRRIFAALNIEVRQLKRIKIGPIKLGELPPGKWRALTETEIHTLLSLGI